MKRYFNGAVSALVIVIVTALAFGAANALPATNAATPTATSTAAAPALPLRPPAASVVQSCTVNGLSPSPSSPQLVGASVTFTASATGCAQYQFYVAPYGGSYSITQAYSSSPSWVWNTSSYAAGSYYVLVFAKATGSVNAYDSYALVPYSLTTPGETCTTATLTTTTTSPQQTTGNPNAVIPFTAGGAGCTMFQFYTAPSGGSYSVAQAYSSSSTFNWHYGSLDAGTYYILVFAKATGSANYYDSYASTSFELKTGSSGCTSASLTPSVASPQLVGTSITFTAAGDVGCAQFQFYLAPYGGSYSIVQPYSSTPTWVWNTSSYAAGTYYVLAFAKATGSTNFYDTSAVVPYTLTTPGQPCTTVTLTPSLASPQDVGTTITLTAAGAGCAQYQFYIAPSGGSYSIVQPYSATSTWVWHTDSYAAGTYSIVVYAKATGSTNYVDSYAMISYRLR